MKQTITLALMLFIGLVGFSQNTLFSTGFEGPGFDEGWTIGMSTSIDETPYNYPSGLDPWEKWAIHDPNPQGYVHTGDSAAFIGGTFTLEDKHDWLMTPHFTVPENAITDVKYWMWYFSGSDLPEFWTWFYIMVYDVAEDQWEMGELILYEINIALFYTEEQSFSLNAWAGKEVKVAFVKRGTYQFALDDISCISINGPDLAMSAITAPSNQNGCELTENEEVTITIKNTGGEDVNTFDVQYTINGSVQVNETVNQPLASGESLDYTFNEKADLSAFGNYSIVVKVTVENDQNPSNDEMTTEVTSSDATITIEILTDQFSPEDNSWVLTDSENNIVASAEIGDLPKQQLYILDVCVFTSECYAFTLYDNFGDGLSGDGGAPGYLTIYYNGTEVGGFSPEEANFGSEFTVDEIGDGCSVNVAEFNASDIRVYPNPVSDILFLENLGGVESLKIIDMLGRERTLQVVGTGNSTTVDFSSFKSGLYLLKIIADNHELNTYLIQKR